jgi:hypothetical protein
LTSLAEFIVPASPPPLKDKRKHRKKTINTQILDYPHSPSGQHKQQGGTQILEIIVDKALDGEISANSNIKDHLEDIHNTVTEAIPEGKRFKQSYSVESELEEHHELIEVVPINN